MSEELRKRKFTRADLDRLGEMLRDPDDLYDPDWLKGT